VFLAAPRPYLEKTYAHRTAFGSNGRGTEYSIDPRSFRRASRCRQTRKRNLIYVSGRSPLGGNASGYRSALLLSDGKWGSASSQSVQYDGDTVIVADLGKATPVETLHLMVYQRPGDFSVESAQVALSGEGSEWKVIAEIKNNNSTTGNFEENALVLSGEIIQIARYVRLTVRKNPDARRILLGEIVIETEKPAEPGDSRHRVPPTPMQIKSVLDKALLDAGVQFLYSCYATDILYDRNGSIAGIVMVNRSGRQAVIARTVIDAMPRSELTRMAAEFQPYPAGQQTFQRIVVGGKPREGIDISHKNMPSPCERIRMNTPPWNTP
jgi:hypothetical protein